MTIDTVSTQMQNLHAPPVDGAARRTLAPFGSREFRLLIAAVALSVFADGMWSVVMTLQVIRLDNDPATLSLVAACLAAGLVAFVLLGGIAADRFNQRAIIVVVSTVNTATAAGVAVLGALGALRVWQLAVAAALLGAAAAFFFPAYTALLPRILPADQLLAANGAEGVIRPVFGQAAGPAVAGIVVGVGAPWLGAAGVASLFGTGLVLLLRTRPGTTSVAAEPDSTAGVLRELREGVRFVVGTPWLLATLLFASVVVLVVLGPIEVLLPFAVAERFADGERSFGFVIAFFGVGSALGALAVSSRRLPRRYLTVMMGLWGLGSAPLMVVGLTSSLPLMTVAVFVIGVTDGAAAVIWGTLLQRRVPAAMLGRVSSLDFFVSLAFMPVSFAVVGPLSKVTGMEVLFLAAGAIPVILAAVAVWAARMYRDEVDNPVV